MDLNSKVVYKEANTQYGTFAFKEKEKQRKSMLAQDKHSNHLSIQ